jgi:hypothetical protein
MSSGFLVGRSATGRDNAAQVTDDGALKVDIGSATLSVTADGVEIKNDSGNPIPTLTGLEIPAHDYIDLSYTGANLTGVVYKDGGSGGSTVATLTLAYDGSNNLISVTKS